MTVQIREESPASLDAYGEVPISFLVTRRLHMVQGDGILPRPAEVPVDPPWVKDYDVDAGPPRRLVDRWNLSTWGVLAAFDDESRVGGALIAWRTEGLDMLEGRDDLAVLWDLRVRPEYRRKRIGSHLLEIALEWAGARGCTRLDVETQDINVPACLFYERHGFRLHSAQPGAYPLLPEEWKLVWSRSLRRDLR